MTCSTPGAANIASSPPEMRIRSSSTISVSYVTWDAFSWTWLLPDIVFETMKLCMKLCCFRKTHLIYNIWFWTPIEVICMLLVKCCNRWCVVLNHYDLGLYVKSCLKSFEIFELPGLWELSTRIWSLLWLFLYLRSYNLVGSIIAGTKDQTWTPINWESGARASPRASSRGREHARARPSLC
jgi:hypothetical protein